MNPTEAKNFLQIPELLRKKLNARGLTANQQQKKKTILGYSSAVKLKAVVRWKERMARAGISTADLATAVKLPSPRISEYLNFTWEPPEDYFHKIESALYKQGA